MLSLFSVSSLFCFPLSLSPFEVGPFRYSEGDWGSIVSFFSRTEVEFGAF